MTLKGKVKKGLGNANFWIKKVEDIFYTKTGMKLFHGTLNIELETPYELEVPNNRILFDQNRKEIFFKNIKTDAVISKTVVNLQFINHLGNICNANSFYKKFYDEEDLITINNPSSL